MWLIENTDLAEISPHRCLVRRASCSEQRVMFMMALPSRLEIPFCCGVWGAVKVSTTPVVLQ